MTSRIDAGIDRQMELQRFELLVRAIHDYAIYMLDVEGNIISWNAGAKRFKGYSASEIIGQHFSRFYTPEDRATGLPSTALNTARTAGTFQAEGWRVRKDGSRFWASVVIDPIYADDGRLVGFAKVTRDVGEKKIAEEALRRSEQQFRLLVQGVVDYAIYMLSPDGLITNWNAGAERIKGYASDEVLGTHFSRFYTSEDQANGVPARALETAKREGRFEREGWRVRRDGSHFMAHVVIDVLHDGDGNFIGFAKITRDITEKHEAALALKRAEQALAHAQKMETIGKLTGGVAHDFNNLLQVISGNLQLLGREIADNENAQRRVENALAGVRRGAKLASQLLAFGRRQALEPKVVNIGQLIVTMDDMLQRALGETINVQTSVQSGLWNAFVDWGQLENAVLNLVVNARDAMEEGGALTIEISNSSLNDAYARDHAEVDAGEYVMVAITDTGCGMPADVAAQVFEPFFTTKPEGKGTGLGLSMVYGFVKQSGGHIKLYSEVGLGTTVKMYLPRAQVETVAQEIIRDERGPIVGGSETILVAEDDDQVRATVVDTLKELGYNVLMACDALGALAVLRSGVKIDLLFTDVVMPGPMRSPELAARARECQPGIAVLFTSGYTRNAIVHGGKLDEGVELLSKPYSREELAGRIRHVLGNQSRKFDRTMEAGRVGVKAPTGLNILLVEVDGLARATTAEVLQSLGHRVTQAKGLHDALSALSTCAIDVLVIDSEIGESSSADLAKAARDLEARVEIIVTGTPGQESSDRHVHTLPKNFDPAMLRALLERIQASTTVR